MEAHLEEDLDQVQAQVVEAGQVAVDQLGPQAHLALLEVLFLSSTVVWRARLDLACSEPLPLLCGLCWTRYLCVESMCLALSCPAQRVSTSAWSKVL